ncbi:40S ribosomal protein S15a-5 [Canna indica]|uniref:Small ribosomal subunit protein uS8c n=1 Tax=Canna indica TaxID=4628 RepID=A0AAQ3KQK9_9LILI|nr:40S ribosomal protein S15a-5 [Canna indica]
MAIWVFRMWAGIWNQRIEPCDLRLRVLPYSPTQRFHRRRNLLLPLLWVIEAMGRRILNDALRTMVNAERREKATATLQPISNVMISFLKIMKNRGYIKDFQVFDPHRVGKITVELQGRIKDCKALTYRQDLTAKNIEEYRLRMLPTRQFTQLRELHTRKGVREVKEALKVQYGIVPASSESSSLLRAILLHRVSVPASPPSNFSSDGCLSSINESHTSTILMLDLAEKKKVEPDLVERRRGRARSGREEEEEGWARSSREKKKKRHQDRSDQEEGEGKKEKGRRRK